MGFNVSREIYSRGKAGGGRRKKGRKGRAHLRDQKRELIFRPFLSSFQSKEPSRTLQLLVPSQAPPLSKTSKPSWSPGRPQKLLLLQSTPRLLHPLSNHCRTLFLPFSKQHLHPPHHPSFQSNDLILPHRKQVQARRDPPSSRPTSSSLPTRPLHLLPRLPFRNSLNPTPPSPLLFLPPRPLDRPRSGTSSSPKFASQIPISTKTSSQRWSTRSCTLRWTSSRSACSMRSF